jgi:integrase
MGKLTDLRVKAAVPNKGQTQTRLSDGEGLSLLVRARDRKWWVFRRAVEGKNFEVGLGSACGAEAVSLAEARDAAQDIRRALKAGRSFDEIRRSMDKTGNAAPGAITFRDMALSYIGQNEKGWRSPVHYRQWLRSLELYAFPKIGDKAPADITTKHVLEILRPIWNDKPETASRLRGRIEKIIAAAKVEDDMQDKFNPATWRGHLDAVLTAKAKVRAVKHHPAMPHDEVGAFMAKLAESEGLAALAFRFLILTATRSAETLGARWSEIDLDKKCWTIPEHRTKTKKAHVVPLSDAALAVLDAAKPFQRDDAVFPGGRHAGDIGILSSMALIAVLRRRKMAVTVHGFRASFRTWCAATSQAPEVAEAALNHAQDAIRSAYQRSDYYDRRVALMAAWATHATTPAAPAGGNVVELDRRRA